MHNTNNDKLTAILNYLQVTDRIASSGQPDSDQFAAIADAGYQLIINLAMPDSPKAIATEADIVAAHQMAYVHIPVPFDSPRAVHLKQFIDAMKAFSKTRVWVHCALNYRVSAFLYLYLQLVEDVSEPQARGALLSAWQPDAVWADFMKLTEDQVFIP